MNRVAEIFQKADWTTPGWNKAKEVLVVLNASDPAILEYDEKIRLITLAMQAATESYDWVDFLIAVTDELSRSKHGQ